MTRNNKRRCECANISQYQVCDICHNWPPKKRDEKRRDELAEQYSCKEKIFECITSAEEDAYREGYNQGHADALAQEKPAPAQRLTIPELNKIQHAAIQTFANNREMHGTQFKSPGCLCGQMDCPIFNDMTKNYENLNTSEEHIKETQEFSHIIDIPLEDVLPLLYVMDAACEGFLDDPWLEIKTAVAEFKAKHKIGEE